MDALLTPPETQVARSVEAGAGRVHDGALVTLQQTPRKCLSGPAADAILSVQTLYRSTASAFHSTPEPGPSLGTAMPFSTRRGSDSIGFHHSAYSSQ